ncbi:MAG: L,D-transpeptidase family protein [Gammaproteobacteria bacterium]|nr:L,D-transpeptidase family protein [Gammaproteobacteria bacterium]
MTQKHLARPTFLACTALWLSACQHLPDSFPGQPKHDIETHRFEINGDVIGELAVMPVKAGDTLPDVARHFELGHDEVAAANPDVDVWLPEPGQQVVLPLKFLLPDAPQQGMVLNLASMRLFYYPAHSLNTVITYPVGIGRQGWSTPQGRMRVTEKMINPVWRVPASIRREHARNGDPLPPVIPAGPDNPLGEHAVRLSMPSYLIHSTNKPYGVGMRISHGCIRLYPENMRALFPALNVGTPVNIVDQPYLVGWRNGVLYLEVHKPLADKAGVSPRPALMRRLAQIEIMQKLDINWARVEDILAREQGIPIPISAGQTINPTRVAHPGHLRGTPVVPPFDANAWYVEAGVFDRSRPAQRIAAMLNHQGPPIPARVLNKDDRFRIWAGPYAHRRAARQAAQRIGRDLYLETRLQAPARAQVTSKK